MSEFIPLLLVLGTALLFPVITGPLAAFIYVKILKQDRQWLWVLFWPVLIAINFTSFYILADGSDDFFDIAGFLACFFTPIIAVSTALGMRLYLSRFYQAEGDDLKRGTWFHIGTVLIPLMQVVTIFLMIVYMP